ARDALVADEPTAQPQASASERVQRLVRDHLASVWRTARDLGVAPCDLDDVAQEVLIVVLRRLDQITPGRERVFAVATAVRVVANWRRRRRRKPLTVTDDLEALHSLATQDGATPAEAELALEKARAAPARSGRDERKGSGRIRAVRARGAQRTRDCSRAALERERRHV